MCVTHPHVGGVAARGGATPETPCSVYIDGAAGRRTGSVRGVHVRPGLSLSCDGEKKKPDARRLHSASPREAQAVAHRTGATGMATGRRTRDGHMDSTLPPPQNPKNSSASRRTSQGPYYHCGAVRLSARSARRRARAISVLAARGERRPTATVSHARTAPPDARLVRGGTDGSGCC